MGITAAQLAKWDSETDSEREFIRASEAKQHREKQADIYADLARKRRAEEQEKLLEEAYGRHSDVTSENSGW